MYCSEYVWKIYNRAANVQLCEKQKLKSFDLSNTVVKKKMQERYKGTIPLEEPVVAPVQLIKSDKLMLVYKN